MSDENTEFANLVFTFVAVLVIFGVRFNNDYHATVVRCFSISKGMESGIGGREVVLITGCSRGGIGYAFALEFASRGFHVVATSRSLASMGGLDDVLGVELAELNVCSLQSIHTAVRHVMETHGRIDILVNNAGVNCVAPVAEVPLTLLDNTFRTNVYGPLSLIQAVVPHMIAAEKGKIVNVGSVVGLAAGPWVGTYAASKAALHALTDSLRLELQPFGIDVVLLVPGAIKSNMGVNASNFLKDVKLIAYKPFEASILRRATYSQASYSTPAADLAKKTIDFLLQKRPRPFFVYGHFGFIYKLLYYAPLWLRDWYFRRTFGLSMHLNSNKKHA